MGLQREYVRLPSLRFSRGALAQLVRAPPCHGGGCGFEPRRLRITSDHIVILTCSQLISKIRLSSQRYWFSRRAWGRARREFSGSGAVFAIHPTPDRA